MKRTSGQTVSVSMHHGKVCSPDDAAPINLLRRRLLSSSSGCEPAAASGNGVRVAGDWEQRVDPAGVPAGGRCLRAVSARIRPKGGG